MKLRAPFCFDALFCFDSHKFHLTLLFAAILFAAILIHPATNVQAASQTLEQPTSQTVAENVLPQDEAESKSVEPSPQDDSQLVLPREDDGNGRIEIEGEMRVWHPLTFTLDGPFADERDSNPNPFLDCRMSLRMTHEESGTVLDIPGYFAADGDAKNTSATRGTKWRAHFSPDRIGTWRYEVGFVSGPQIAVTPEMEGMPVARYGGSFGNFDIGETDKTGQDFRALGRLQYVRERYLECARTGREFVKAGPDSPETLLAYSGFDDTTTGQPEKAPIKNWQPHVRDFRDGDPVWKDGAGQGLIGAINYLADKGLNACSFLTYNVGGDGDNVWPHVSNTERLHFDCSKLDQWQVVFNHANNRGILLHIKLQETENDDRITGTGAESPGPGLVPAPPVVAAAMDDGKLGVERKLYLRELIARFSHLPALEWNLGEENTQTTTVQRQTAAFIQDLDPYLHPVVLHTFPGQQDAVYKNLLGSQGELTGVSLQNNWFETHNRTLIWVVQSSDTNRPWVVASDEQGPANLGVPADPGFEGSDGIARMAGNQQYNLHDVRKRVLWGNIMAGGAGVNYYFGYSLPQNDLACEDFRSRDKSWDYCRFALEFLRQEQVPLRFMNSADWLVGNEQGRYGVWCLAEFNHTYMVYAPDGLPFTLDLTDCDEEFEIIRLNPRDGTKVRIDPANPFRAPGKLKMPAQGPQGDDWLYLIRKPEPERQD